MAQILQTKIPFQTDSKSTKLIQTLKHINFNNEFCEYVYIIYVGNID